MLAWPPYSLNPWGLSARSGCRNTYQSGEAAYRHSVQLPVCQRPDAAGDSLVSVEATIAPIAIET